MNLSSDDDGAALHLVHDSEVQFGLIPFFTPCKACRDVNTLKC